ncbi:MAG: DNA-3-methyladenine glycosylase I [bacterium]|nr:DNA-3-methyladenine glycosylase I [bacterium]
MEEHRCGWGIDHGIVQAYHDQEWGIPVHEDKVHFEYLLMEVMQCGLNWTMMLKKREIFRSCFDAFDFYKIAQYDQEKIDQIMQTEGMIHSIRKITAIIQNAKLFLKIIEEYGSFDEFLWRHSGYKTIVYKSHTYNQLPDHNELSDQISKELKKRGFKYLGSITIYSHLQACGMINDHDRDCYRYAYINEHYPVEERE